MTHYSEDDLTLYYYGEGRGRAAIERHLDACAACRSLNREIAGTLAMIAAPEAPERGDQYGLEVWQRIRHELPEQDAPWWTALFRVDLLAVAANLIVAGLLGAHQIHRAVRHDPVQPRAEIRARFEASDLAVRA